MDLKLDFLFYKKNSEIYIYFSGKNHLLFSAQFSFSRLSRTFLLCYLSVDDEFSMLLFCVCCTRKKKKSLSFFSTILATFTHTHTEKRARKRPEKYECNFSFSCVTLWAHTEQKTANRNKKKTGKCCDVILFPLWFFNNFLTLSLLLSFFFWLIKLNLENIQSLMIKE